MVICSCRTVTLDRGKLNLSKKKDVKEVNNQLKVKFDPNSSPRNITLDQVVTSSEIYSDANKTQITPFEKAKPLIKQFGHEPNCDKILLKTGEEIDVKVEEIGINEIKYKKCNNLSGPLITISKEDVFMITYSNGTKDVIKSSEKKIVNESIFSSNKDNENGELNALALTSFILGILGFIPALGIIFGIIAKIQIRKNPEKYRGETFATVGIILSILWWVFILLFIF